MPSGHELKFRSVPDRTRYASPRHPRPASLPCADGNSHLLSSLLSGHTTAVAIAPARGARTVLLVGGIRSVMEAATGP